MASAADSVRKLVIDYVDRLKENNIPIQKVVLFGSYARGTPGKDSDIDVALVSASFQGDRYEDRRRIVPFRRGLDCRIEPIPITPADFEAGGILIDEIKKTGQIIPI